MNKEHVRSEILRLRRQNAKLDEKDVAQLVKDFKSARQAHLDAEVAEYELGLRSPSRGLSQAEQGHLVGLMAQLATRLYLDGGPDVETYLRDEVKAVDVQDHSGA